MSVSLPPPETTRAAVPSARPPEIDASPPDFSLCDTEGTRVHLAELYVLGPLVLVFFRNSESRACVEQLREYKKRNAALLEAGATVVAISCDDRIGTRELVARERLPFRVLVDDEGYVLERWGLRDSTGRSRTATFVVDRSGTVRWRAIDRDASRTPAAHVLDWLNGHGGEGQAQS